MNEPKKTLCIGGPLAGDSHSACPINYIGWAWDDFQVYAYAPDFSQGQPQDILKQICYGYEQHCKAVAERYRVDFGSQAEKWKSIMEFIETYGSKKKAEIDKAEEDLKAIQDHYTASFLRSCRTCIIPSPFSESTPLTLSYGKCYKGYLNEAMEFVVYAGTINGEPEKSMGRISSPICIVP